MFGITNREVRKNESGTEQLGTRPNAEGPNELRMFQARRASAKKWSLTLIDDKLDAAAKQQLGLPPEETAYGSYLVARRLLQRSREHKRHILFYVHGFNNDVEDVLDRAERLETLYDVEVVPFSWPANGGGARGVASYRSDKRDARASSGALDRTLAKIADYLEQFSEEIRRSYWEKAAASHPDNPTARDELFARLVNQDCPLTINLLLHSMGGYLLKRIMKSTASEGTRLVFDNILLAAADVNNLDHKEWIERIRFRRRLYVTINEDDSALAASRVKAGEEQLARLGHYPFRLDAANATYVNFTGAKWVTGSHAYFEGRALRNSRVKAFFRSVLKGGTPETQLPYVPDRNYYVVQ